MPQHKNTHDQQVSRALYNTCRLRLSYILTQQSDYLDRSLCPDDYIRENRKLSRIISSGNKTSCCVAAQ